MPIYEYRCGSCDHLLEALQKINDPLLSRCPACGEERLVRQVSAASFRLKGSGWYETDFKQDKRKRLSGSDDQGAGTADSKAGTGPEKAEHNTGSADKKDGQDRTEKAGTTDRPGTSAGKGASEKSGSGDSGAGKARSTGSESRGGESGATGQQDKSA